jgi:hypothetical protein
MRVAALQSKWASIAMERRDNELPGGRSLGSGEIHNPAADADY